MPSMLAQFSRPRTIVVDAESPSYQLRAALAQRLASHRLAARETMLDLTSRASGIALAATPCGVVVADALPCQNQGL
jgi:hypothetical protein